MTLRVVGRVVLGAVSGWFIGRLVGIPLFLVYLRIVRQLAHGPITHDLSNRYMTASAIVGAALGGIAGGTVGSVEIRGRAKSLAVGALTGVVLGFLAGFPLGKGVLIIMPLGATLGLVAGGLYPELTPMHRGEWERPVAAGRHPSSPGGPGDSSSESRSDETGEPKRD